jgi:hypothetical protein
MGLNRDESVLLSEILDYKMAKIALEFLDFFDENIFSKN